MAQSHYISWYTISVKPACMLTGGRNKSEPWLFSAFSIPGLNKWTQAENTPPPQTHLCLPLSHLSICTQLHSLQPDHHLLGTDASWRVPLTPSFQLYIPDDEQHTTFLGFHYTAQHCSLLNSQLLLLRPFLTHLHISTSQIQYRPWLLICAHQLA